MASGIVKGIKSEIQIKLKSKTPLLLMTCINKVIIKDDRVVPRPILRLHLRAAILVSTVPRGGPPCKVDFVLFPTLGSVNPCLLLKPFVFLTAIVARGEHKTRVTGDEGQETVIPTILRKKRYHRQSNNISVCFETVGFSHCHFTFIVTTHKYSHHRQRSTGRSRSTLPVKKR